MPYCRHIKSTGVWPLPWDLSVTHAKSKEDVMVITQQKSTQPSPQKHPNNNDNIPSAHNYTIKRHTDILLQIKLVLFNCWFLFFLVLTFVSLAAYKQFHNPSVKQHDILIEIVIHNDSKIRHHQRKRLNSLRLQYATFHLEATKCIVSPLFVPSGVQLRPALVTQFDGLLRGHSAWGSGNIKPLWTLKTWTEEVNV